MLGFLSLRGVDASSDRRTLSALALDPARCALSVGASGHGRPTAPFLAGVGSEGLRSVPAGLVISAFASCGRRVVFEKIGEREDSRRPRRAPLEPADLPRLSGPRRPTAGRGGARRHRAAPAAVRGPVSERRADAQSGEGPAARPPSATLRMLRRFAGAVFGALQSSCTHGVGHGRDRVSDAAMAPMGSLGQQEGDARCGASAVATGAKLHIGGPGREASLCPADPVARPSSWRQLKASCAGRQIAFGATGW